MAHKDDTSLYEAIRDFFTVIKKNGTLAQLKERHYGHIGRLNFVDTRDFKRHIKDRLPKYEAFFPGPPGGRDWLRLATGWRRSGYQESHWRPNAQVPHTGYVAS